MRKNFFSWNYFKYTIDELIETFNSNSKPQSVHFIASHALAEAYKDSQLYDIFIKIGRNKYNDIKTFMKI